ncbi:hypothetical protein NYA28ABAC_00938 [Salinicola sp. NYA28a]
MALLCHRLAINLPALAKLQRRLRKDSLHQRFNPQADTRPQSAADHDTATHELVAHPADTGVIIFQTQP